MSSYTNEYMKRSRRAVIFIYLLLLISAIGTVVAFAQTNESLTQQVKGTISDAASKSALIGATIQVLNSNPIIGTVTNLDGEFTLHHIPVGRVDFLVSYLGFESKTVSNVVIHSGKETILHIELTEAIVSGNEIKINAFKNNGLPTNDMAIVGAKSISTEEMTRLTASFNDPAFITSNFAGVRNSGTGGNDIIIRGNSPKYMQWRLEGVPINNPNHFADQNLVMGSTSTLNANLLATSDFYMGAFPAEYGNAVSGVYDIKLRNGNSAQYESILGLGLIGSDITLEGPITKGSGNSFLVNYRNSTASVLNDMGMVEVEGDPRFRDAAFKLNIPTNNVGVFSAFGLGGYSSFMLEDVTPFDWNSPGNSGMRDDVTEDFDKTSLLFNSGINHFINVGNRGFLNTSISYSIEKLDEDLEQHLSDLEMSQVAFKSSLQRSRVQLSSSYSQKLNARTSFEIGSLFALFMESFDQEFRQSPEQPLLHLQDFDEKVVNLRNYISVKHRINQQLVFTAGLQNNNVFFIDEFSLEPRLAAKWQMTTNTAFNLGYGLHSTMEQLHHYYANIQQADGSFHQPNKTLNLMKAHHFTGGVDHYFTPNVLGKIEVYYQHLFEVPVHTDPNSYYSTLNEGNEIEYFALSNNGTAENYGIELTLQKFFSSNYYFLINSSFYEAKYTANDGIERDSRFNGNYAVNAIFGKEFNGLGQRNNQTLGLNFKVFAGGAQKIIPLLKDNEGNAAVNPATNEYFDYTQAFASGLDDLYMITLSASYKIERARSTHELFLNIENLTNYKGKLTEYYDTSSSNGISHTTMFGILPNLMYRVYL